MDTRNKLGFLKLAKKSFAVITTSFGVLLNNQSKALPQTLGTDEGGNLNYAKFQKKILKPKLVLKLNFNDPSKSLLASHSSHSSHSSHASHYSGASGGGQSDDGRGLGIGALIVGGALVYGAYRVGKNKGGKK